MISLMKILTISAFLIIGSNTDFCLEPKPEDFWSDIENIRFGFIQKNFQAGDATSGILNNKFKFKLEKECQLGRYYLSKKIKDSSRKLVGSAYVKTCVEPWQYSDSEQILLGLIISQIEFPNIGNVPKVGDSISSLVKKYPNYEFMDKEVMIYRKGQFSLTLVLGKEAVIKRVIMGKFFQGYPIKKFLKEIKKLAYIYN